MDSLITRYEEILSQIDYTKFDKEKDKYSGVFLPIPFEEYLQAEKKIMVIGRETAGWNTNNHLNTIFRIQEKGSTHIVSEAIEKYRTHLIITTKGKVKITSRSRFKQYYFKIAKELKISPKELVYSNFFAWDYNKKSPLLRPKDELNEIKRLSLKILAAQIEECKPDYIIFATGIHKAIDDSIKELFNLYFDGYVTNKETLIPKKLWEFDAAGARCFRIAHPRATYGHQIYRRYVLDKLKEK